MKKLYDRKKTLACTVKEKVLNNLSVFVKQTATNCKFSTSESWAILSPIAQRIKAKIETIGTPLKDWDINIYRGILTGYNEAFIIDGKKKNELIAEDSKSAEIIRPILRGRDIKRYSVNFADLYLIATFPSKKYNIEDYPAVKQHLLSYGYDRLKQTGDAGARKKTNNNWFETQDSISYWEDFFRPKIVWGNLCLKSQFALADEGYFVNAPSPMIVPSNKYILAVLNSPIADWYIRGLGVTRNGGYFEYKPMFIEKVPVPKIEKQLQQKFDELIDQLIQKYDSGVEQNVNNLIYNIYKLTNKEITYIENKVQIT